jgi:hypothetical protein
MKQLIGVIAGIIMIANAPAGLAESTLEKIDLSGTLVIGTRTGSPPFAYVDQKNQWVGFSIDLVERAVIPALSKKLNKSVKLEKKESAPATRIPLLTSNAVDLIAETMTDTQSRRDNVDFSITFFVTGAQFLARKGSPIKGIQTIAGKRVAAQQGSTNAKIIRERVPSAKLVEFPDQPAAFQALAQRHARLRPIESLHRLVPFMGLELEIAAQPAQSERGIAHVAGHPKLVPRPCARTAQRLSRARFSHDLHADDKRPARRIAADEVYLMVAREVEEAVRELLQPALIRRGEG